MIAAVYFMKPVNKVEPILYRGATEAFIINTFKFQREKRLNELLINRPTGKRESRNQHAIAARKTLFPRDISSALRRDTIIYAICRFFMFQNSRKRLSRVNARKSCTQSHVAHRESRLFPASSRFATFSEPSLAIQIAFQLVRNLIPQVASFCSFRAQRGWMACVRELRE